MKMTQTEPHMLQLRWAESGGILAPLVNELLGISDNPASSLAFCYSVSRGKGAGSSVSQTRLTLSKRGCYTCSLSTECTLANKFSEMNSKQRHFGISCATTCCRWKMMLQMLRWWSKHILDFQGLFLMVSCRLMPTHAIRGQCSLQRHCIPCEIYLAKTHWQPRPNILQQ